MANETTAAAYAVNPDKERIFIEVCDTRRPHKNGVGLPIALCPVPEWAELIAELLNARQAGIELPHPDTVRLDHLIEWHHSTCDYAEVGAETAETQVDDIDFIFDRTPGIDLREDVRAAIDRDRANVAAMANHCGVVSGDGAGQPLPAFHPTEERVA